jgi:hypothetical protein
MHRITGSYSDNVVTIKVFIFRNVRPCNLVGIYMSEERSACIFKYQAFGAASFGFFIQAEIPTRAAVLLEIRT